MHNPELNTHLQLFKFSIYVIRILNSMYIIYLYTYINQKNCIIDCLMNKIIKYIGITIINYMNGIGR